MKCFCSDSKGKHRSSHRLTIFFMHQRLNQNFVKKITWQNLFFLLLLLLYYIKYHIYLHMSKATPFQNGSHITDWTSKPTWLIMLFFGIKLLHALHKSVRGTHKREMKDWYRKLHSLNVKLTVQHANQTFFFMSGWLCQAQVHYTPQKPTSLFRLNTGNDSKHDKCKHIFTDFPVNYCTLWRLLFSSSTQFCMHLRNY